MDVRIERTRRALQEALFALARERPLEELTIADIVTRAGVNRSSFYQHYSDKETLLADALDAAVEQAGAALAELPELAEPPAGPPPSMFDYLTHLDDNAEVYRRVLGPQGSVVVMARLRDRLESIVRDGIARSGVRAFEGLPLDVVGAGIAGSALGVIEVWLARDPRPPVATASEWLWRMILGPSGVWDASAFGEQDPAVHDAGGATSASAADSG
ncbi:TetR/AcrR family transcriptional regulator [Agromyces sp. ISL-38]|uniref:TetR/AcrR family transcriptional regulator n=1 Tax=Agromyces sp. ISL-38 TaxID=2819107 RepID=UPI001BE9A0FA|nr:TetR/AcrR family transcriptional regulator [Agromyces sp. ISL-38]MBT2499276.1 TetR/AcrR family transcriptional regulator [Agromyces sp. ISL-38]MBT2518187.1 TetR/AcrR family transcriptional regulator [Streptomyces sp. ISL-90]